MPIRKQMPSLYEYQLIDQDAVDAFRSRSGNNRKGNDSARRIMQNFNDYAEMIAGSLPLEDRQDLVMEVFERAWPSISNRSLGRWRTLAELNRRILQDFWRTRQKYLASANFDLGVFAIPAADSSVSADPLRILQAKQELRGLVSRAEYVLMPSLNALPDDAFNVIVGYYRLDKLGIPLRRASQSPPVPRRVTTHVLAQARKSFQAKVEAEILRLLEVPRVDRVIFEKLLRIVRGGKFLLLFEEAAS